MGGLGILFHRRGIARIDTVGLRNLYCEYRPVEVCLSVSSRVIQKEGIKKVAYAQKQQISVCLTSNRSSFLSSNEWRNPPWRNHYSPVTSPLQDLLDIAFDIPLPLQKWERAKNNGAGSQPFFALESTLSTEDIEELLTELLAVNHKLQTWHADFSDPSQESIPFGERPTTCKNHRLDPDELSEGKLFPTSYTFTQFPVAMAFVYFEGICIQLLKNIDEMCTVLAERGTIQPHLQGGASSYAAALSLLRRPDVTTSVTRILQCAEYFLESDKKLLGPTSFMFAFHVAFSALCRLSKSGERGIYRRELRWCQMISEEYEERRLASLASLDLGKPFNAFFEMLAS